MISAGAGSPSDPSANPYLALAVALAAGLDGIRNKMTLPAPTNSNIYEMTTEERLAQGIDRLPGNLWEAIGEFRKDAVIREALGEHVFFRYMEGKEQEWDEYSKQIHDWEIKAYLNKH